MGFLQWVASTSGLRVSFLVGSFVGLLIAGASLGSLISDEHKRGTAGVWLGIGLWFALVSTVHQCRARRDPAPSERALSASER